MSTMAVIVEILVIGVQAWVALMLWVLGFLGHGVVLKPLSLLTVHGGAWKWMPVLGLVVLAICYTLGIAADRVALALFDRVVRPVLRLLCPAGVRRLFLGKALPLIGEDEVLVQVLQQERVLAPFLQDYRSRLRIMRATWMNSVLIWMAFWMTPQLRLLLPLSPPTVRFVTVLGAVFLVLWIVLWGVQHVTYQERLEQARRVIGGGRGR